jgi:hypothetical protein
MKIKSKKWLAYFINSRGKREGVHIVADTADEAMKVYMRFAPPAASYNIIQVFE